MDGYVGKGRGGSEEYIKFVLKGGNMIHPRKYQIMFSWIIIFNN